MKWELDKSAPNVGIVLGMCLDCGWRGLATDELTALERLYKHELHSHTGSHSASSAYKNRLIRAERHAAMHETKQGE